MGFWQFWRWRQLGGRRLRKCHTVLAILGSI
jgi:hypothetical protein